MHKLRRALAPLVVVTMLGLSACGNAQSAKVTTPSTESSTTASMDAAQYPQTVKACDTSFDIKKAPERVMFINSTGTSALLDLGLIDRVVARIGVVETSTYSQEDAKKIKDIEVIESAVKGGGHYNVSTEAVIEKHPDLIIASNPADLDVQKLYDAGIAIYVPEEFCVRDNTEKVTFDNVYREIRTFAKVFGVTDRAEKVIEKLKGEVKASGSTKVSGTAAAVFVVPGDSKFYAYGNSSMVTPQFEALGLNNVYGNEKKRVFTVSTESLLEHNPDRIIILHQGDEQGAIETFKQAHGASDLRAVREGNLVGMPFPLTDPPSSLSVEGLKYLQNKLK
ncbi:ABC transporter substrate-binding protein [Trueperella pyogenes]|uniref:ABC transporter substrate-binding protein n=1 Tax=Trueperella pyogenes TaxID=1661 RepID=UPI00345CEE1E